MHKVTVIGAGGVGSRIIQLSHKLFDITAMDGDLFEKKNIDRQIMKRSHIGINKAVAMGDMFGVNAIPEFLDEPEQLKGHEFIVCVPDNHACRLTAIEASDMYDIPVVLAGNEEWTANAMYYSGKYRGTSADPRVRYPDMLNAVRKENGDTCTERITTKPQTALANSMAANFAIALAVYWTGDLPPDDILDAHAPFEFIWSKTITETVRGLKDV
jgi:hypothetical protein